MSNDHLVPEVYLKNFSTDNQIYVFDKNRGSYFDGKPNIGKVARERNFYDKELESYFSKIETHFDEFTKYIFKNNSIPTKESEEFIYLMRFLNLQKQRVKLRRDTINANTKQIIKEKILPLLNMADSNFNVDNYSTFRSLISDSTSCIETAKCFAYRKWQLLVTNENFITSDNPVILTWAENGYQENINPGLASFGSTILFPISSKYAVTGIMPFDKDNSDKNFLLKLSEQEQALFGMGSHFHDENKILTGQETDDFNKFIIGSSQRFLFSKEKDAERYL